MAAKGRSGSSRSHAEAGGATGEARDPLERQRKRSRGPRDLQAAPPSRRLRVPLLDPAGKKSKDLSLQAAVFGAEVKPHLVHETVRAELNAHRAGSHSVKTRGLVRGGRGKPWRQKGTGRARAGTTRASQWTGGGVAFLPRTNFEVKVNRKVRRAAFRGALSAHAERASFGVVDGAAFAEPSTKQAVGFLDGWSPDRPLLVVATAEEANVVKSFRNLARVQVVEPGELEVAALAWARSLLVTEAALPLVEARAAGEKEQQ